MVAQLSRLMPPSKKIVAMCIFWRFCRSKKIYFFASTKTVTAAGIVYVVLEPRPPEFHEDCKQCRAKLIVVLDAQSGCEQLEKHNVFGWMSRVMCAPPYSMSLDPHRLEASRARLEANWDYREAGKEGRKEGRKD